MRENPIPLLILFLLIAAVPAVVSAQTDREPARLTVEQRAELDRIRKLTTRGPHRKNPLAAGRMLTLKAADRAAKAQASRRRMPRGERRERSATFTSLRYREPHKRSEGESATAPETNKPGNG